MPLTEAQKKATRKYMKERAQRFTLNFYPPDADIYQHIRNQPNMAGYIKQLIRQDMEKHKEA